VDGPQLNRDRGGDRERGRTDTRDQENWRRDNFNNKSSSLERAQGPGQGQGQGRPTSASASAGVLLHSDHVTELEREQMAELMKYQEDVRKLTEDKAELADKIGNTQL
jgi:hypothetical protein